MTHWLRGLGYRTKSAGIRANIDCSASVTDALERRLEEMNRKHGDKVAIVGQSRGGIIARALAVRRPDLVSGIITLGSPTRQMLQVHPVVLGAGTSFFPALDRPLALRLRETHRFASGAVYLGYTAGGEA